MMKLYQRWLQRPEWVKEMVVSGLIGLTWLVALCLVIEVGVSL